MHSYDTHTQTTVYTSDPDTHRGTLAIIAITLHNSTSATKPIRSPTDLQFLQLGLDGEAITSGVGTHRQLVKCVLQPGPGFRVHLTVLLVVLAVLVIPLQQVLRATIGFFSHRKTERE